ncbi:MAG: hypothetical protein IPN34_12180 [Planctomycetes bacterium]|nr:hypothetical protein [Planctomycetota bacterium]
MGIWRGKAAVSSGGDWTHGSEIHLKFNSYKSTKKVAPADAEKIGRAYSAAAQMVESALGGLYEEKNADLVRMYFGDKAPRKEIEGVLRLTLNGLKDTSEGNKIFLFTKTSRPELGANTSGKVSSWKREGTDASTQKWAISKRKLPVSSSFEKASGGLDNIEKKYEAYKGRIHLNLFHIKNRQAEEVAITIIHEATHRFAGTGDFGYNDGTRKWYSMTDEERLNNADSYAYFCRDAS